MVHWFWSLVFYLKIKNLTQRFLLHTILNAFTVIFACKNNGTLLSVITPVKTMHVSNNLLDGLFTSSKMTFLRSDINRKKIASFSLICKKNCGTGIVDVDNHLGREIGKFCWELKISRNNLARTLHVHNKIVHAKTIATIKMNSAKNRNCSFK